MSVLSLITSTALQTCLGSLSQAWTDSTTSTLPAYQTVADQAVTHLSWLSFSEPQHYVRSTQRLLRRELQADSAPSHIDEATAIRDGLSLLRLIGLEWETIDQLVPGAHTFYETRACSWYADSAPEVHFGYPWAEPEDEVLSVDTPTFESKMDIQNDHLILNPMTGTGEEAIRLATRHPESFVLAYDINPDSIVTGVSTLIATEHPDPNITFTVHDAHTSLALADHSVNRLVINGYSTFGFSDAQLVSFFADQVRMLASNSRIWMDFLPYRQPSVDSHTFYLELAAHAAGRRLQRLDLPAELNAYAGVIE